MGRNPEHEQRARAGRPSDREREREIDRDLRAGEDAEEDDEADDRPRNDAPAATHVRADDHCERRGDGGVDDVGEPGTDDPRVLDARRVQRGRTGPVDQRVDHPHERGGRRRGRRGDEYDPRTLGADERDDEHDRIEHGDELRHAEQEALERGGQLLEEAEQLLFESLEGTGVDVRDEQRDEEEEHGGDEREQRNRRTLGCGPVRLGDVDVGYRRSIG